MKIAFFCIKGVRHFSLPLGLGYLKSNMPPGHEVAITDCFLKNLTPGSPELERLLIKMDPQVVGVTAYSLNIEEALRILWAAKSVNPKITTVVGGPHASSYPDFTMENSCVDFLFRGESELSFARFIRELEKPEPKWEEVKGLVYRISGGQIKKNEIILEKDLDKIKMPDYDAINLEDYIKRGYNYGSAKKRQAPIWISRGCPYRCEFCAASIMNGKHVRTHSVDYIVNWVKYLYYEKGINCIGILDDNFTFHVEFAKELCGAMIDLGLKDLHFSSANGIRFQRADAELFKLMKLAGWEDIVIAPESGSKKTLESMKKDVDLNMVPEKIKEIKKSGLIARGNFIVGYPGETVEDLRQTQRFLRKCKFNIVQITCFQPMPGTPIYQKLVKNGEISANHMPDDLYSGKTKYIPKDLKGFNFSRYILLNYLYVFFSSPRNMLYVYKLVRPKMLLELIINLAKNTLARRKAL